MLCRRNSKSERPIKCAMLSGCPVTKLSNPTTAWPSARNRSARWEPRNPAAPVIRTRMGSDASDRVVREAERAHLLRVVEVATVDQDRALQRLFDPPEIRVAVLVPVGDDDERVGAMRRVIVRIGVRDAIAQPPPRFVLGDRVMRF